MTTELSTGHAESFDAHAYWSGRLVEGRPMEAVGTRPFGENYQRYLYRLKEAAIRRVLRMADRRRPRGAGAALLHGAHVLNVGCGWGYFEPVFDRLGAASVTGIDFVDAVVERLRRQRPRYEYLAADITDPLPDALSGRTFDVVSAIDVLYHVVDDARFQVAVENLCQLCRPDGGLLIWVDAPRRSYDPRHPHCRYRRWNDYDAVFERFGVSLHAATPMYHLFDTYSRRTEWLARYPTWTYPAMYAFDRGFARLGWRATANHCALAVRDVGGGTERRCNETTQGDVDCELRIADCGFAKGGSIRNSQSEIRNRPRAKSVPPSESLSGGNA